MNRAIHTTFRISNLTEMTKEKLLTYLVIVLVLVNGLALGFLFLNKKSHPLRRRELFQLVERELSLTDTQVAAYRKLRHGHREKMNALDGKFNECLITYFNLLRDSTLMNRDSLETRLANIEKEKARVTLNHFSELKRILSADQQQKFDALIPELLSVMGPRNSPPPPRRD
jgi:hypothetical protein